MAIHVIECGHYRAFRDPAPCFDLYQSLLMVGGLFYCSAFVWDYSISAVVPPWSLPAIVLILMAPWIGERRLDALARINELSVSDLRCDSEITIIGRPTQVRRLLDARSLPPNASEVFRSGLRSETQVLLFFILFIALQAMSLFFGVSRAVLSIVAVTAFGMAVLQYSLGRRRYRINGGKLFIEELRGLRVTAAREFNLSGSNASINFAKALVVLKTATEECDVDLNELLRPNRFAALIIGSIREKAG